MFKHPRASKLSRGFPLVGLFVGSLATCAVSACASQSSGPPHTRSDTKTTTPSVATRRAPAASSEGLLMRAEQGSIDRDDAEGAITAHWPKLKVCYQQAGDAMAFAEGGVMLRFEVAITGQPTAVDVIESRLGNFAVERCLVDAARGVRFPRPHGGGTARVEYTLEFRSTDERPVTDLPPEAAEELRASLRAQVFGACGQLNAPDLDATVYIDRRGRVASAGLASRTPVVPHRAACAAAALTSAVVPATSSPSGEALSRITIAMPDAALIEASNAAAAVAAKAKIRPNKDRLASKPRRRRR